MTIKRTKENVLFVDDTRVMRFESTVARRLNHAQALLYSRPWDEVWLDFDMTFSMTEKEVLEQDNVSTMGLVRRIAKDAEQGIILPVQMFVLHSGMPEAKEWQAEMLLPWYTVGVTDAEAWVLREEYPWWADAFLHQGDWGDA